MSKKQNLAADQLLKTTPLFSFLKDEIFEDVKRFIFERYFPRNQVILYEDETTEYLYIIRSGKVKVVQIDQQGLEQIVAVHKKGDFFGEMGILDGKTTPARVVATEDSKILFLKKEHFVKYFLNNSEALSVLVSILCYRLREAWFNIRVMRITDARRRICAVLNHLGTTFGIVDSRGIIINMRLTHSYIASYAALSRETVSRNIKKLERSGEIEMTSDRRIILKPSFEKTDYL